MKIKKCGVGCAPPMDLLLMADPSIQMVEKYLQNGQCFIAVEFNRVMGVYILIPTGTGTIELVNIAVAEEYQGKGIGKKLVLDAVERAKSLGYKKIEVGTGNSSINQLALYQKCGFRIVGVDLDFFTRHYDEEIYENGIQCRDMIRLSQDLSGCNFS